MASKKDIEFHLESVTPELAEQYLTLNKPTNRPVSPFLVDKYAKEMTAGKWRLTHEAIAFDAEANLINGQHRLSAILRSGVTVELFVAYNCDPSTFNVIDVGRVRSTSDIFVIAFKQRFGEHPASPTFVTAIASGMLSGCKSDKKPKDEVWEYAIKRYKLINNARTKLKSQSGTQVVGTNVVAAFANASLYYGAEAVDPLMERMGSEMWTGATDPLKVLHGRLVRAKIDEARGDALAKSERYGYAVAAIRASLNGDQRTKLEGSAQDFGESETDRRIRGRLRGQQ